MNDTFVEIYFVGTLAVYYILKFLLYFADSTADFELPEKSLNVNVLAEHVAFVVENIALVEVVVFADVACVAVVIKFVFVVVFVVVSDDSFVVVHSFDSIVYIVVADVNVVAVAFVELLEEIVIESVQFEEWNIVKK